MKELIKHACFGGALNSTKLSSWLSLKSVIANFLSNLLSPEYEKTVEELVSALHIIIIPNR